MSTAAGPFDQWQIAFHEAMAALLRAQGAIKAQFGLWGMLGRLWKCSRDLKTLTAYLKTLSEVPDGVLGNEFVESQIPQMRKLLRSIEDLIDAAKRSGLMNRSLTSASLGAIKIHGEYIADYLETLEMSIDPEVLQAVADGRTQIENGEFELMERLF